MKFYRFFRKSIFLILFTLFGAFPVSVSGQQMDREQRIADFLKNSGNYEQALALYLKAYHAGKQNFILINNIQQCYEKLKQYPDLIVFLQDVIKRNPGNLEYRVKLGRAYYLNGNPEKAIALWDSLLKTHPENIYLYRSLGANLIQLRLYDRAIRVYRAAIENIPRQKSLYREIAMIYRAQLDYAHALKNYLNYYKAFPSQFGYIRSQIIAMSSDTSAIVPMITVLQEYQQHNKSLLGVNELLADMFLRQRNYAAGFKVYLSLYKKTGESNYLYRFANKAAKAEAFDFANKALQILTKEAGNSKRKALFRLELARNYYKWAKQLIAKGQQKKAIKKIGKAEKFADELLHSKPRSGYWWAACDLKGDIALTYYQDVDRAITWYQNVLAAHIDIGSKDRTRLKLARCYLIKGNLNRSLHILNEIRSAMYGNLVRFKKAEILFYQGKLHKAKQAFQNLSQTLSAEDSLANNVLERLLLLNYSDRDSAVLVKFARAELLKRQEKLSEAARIFEQLEKKQSDLSARCGEEAVNLYIKMGKLDLAEKLIRKIENDYPNYVNNDRLYFLLALARQREKRWQEAFETYQALINKYPDSFLLEQARENARMIRKLYLKAQVE